MRETGNWDNAYKAVIFPLRSHFDEELNKDRAAASSQKSGRQARRFVTMPRISVRIIRQNRIALPARWRGKQLELRVAVVCDDQMTIRRICG
ncbi:hypothetical protein [Bradyrhizobium vignae]|uniref:Transposase n=1 Tax=Bradyrhizobium vignae TaxID=1549949 RepID=A0ABS4A169_9BRAD|nr:hypothetical protein [Bradyrhizobium vignae]MBP0114157.1 hypothetical protein [Bradyrhizobium vignae]